MPSFRALAMFLLVIFFHYLTPCLGYNYNIHLMEYGGGEKILIRPALGSNAVLGELYSARTDSFIVGNLFGKRGPRNPTCTNMTIIMKNVHNCKHTESDLLGYHEKYPLDKDIHVSLIGNLIIDNKRRWRHTEILRNQRKYDDCYYTQYETHVEFLIANTSACEGGFILGNGGGVMTDINSTHFVCGLVKGRFFNAFNNRADNTIEYYSNIPEFIESSVNVTFPEFHQKFQSRMIATDFVSDGLPLSYYMCPLNATSIMSDKLLSHFTNTKYNNLPDYVSDEIIKAYNIVTNAMEAMANIMYHMHSSNNLNDRGEEMDKYYSLLINCHYNVIDSVRDQVPALRTKYNEADAIKLLDTVSDAVDNVTNDEMYINKILPYLKH